jgi:hypothetical protein
LEKVVSLPLYLASYQVDLSEIPHPSFAAQAIGKYSFVNRSITDWNKLSEGAIGTSHGKTHIFKTRVRKVKTSEGK